MKGLDIEFLPLNLWHKQHIGLYTRKLWSYIFIGNSCITLVEKVNPKIFIILEGYLCSFPIKMTVTKTLPSGSFSEKFLKDMPPFPYLIFEDLVA